MDKRRNECDISKCLVLVPTFRESEVDSYFATFERLAAALDWPREVWSTLLQCKLTGNAQEVIASLSLSDSMDYDKVKAAVLVAYELVPEAYRQKFRSQNVKLSTQTYVEFSREKALMFDKWILASKVKTLQDLKELILMEEFKKCLPERLAIYLNERKVSSLFSAALLADEFVLTHCVNSDGCRGESARPVSGKPFKSPPSPPRPQKPRCYYCHLVGHVARDCVVLKRKNKKRGSAMQPVGFVSKSRESYSDLGFGPFMSEGHVSLTDSCETLTPVQILRDTGASQTLILQNVLPFDDLSSTGSSVLLAGVNSVPVSRPLHRIYLRSGLFTGSCEVAVCPSLPVEGVALLLGNDLAGGAVIPPPVVKESISPGECEEAPAGVLPTCVCTRSQAKRAHEILDVSSLFDGSQCDVSSLGKSPSSTLPVTNKDVSPNIFPLSPASLEVEQRSDDSLTICFENVGGKVNGTTGYVIKNDVLLRNWCKPVAKNIPDRRRKNCVCNVNMLERYLSPQTTAQPPGEAAVCAAAAITPVLDEVTQTHLVAPELPLCSIYLDNIVTHTSSWDDLLALENPVTHLEPTSFTTNLATHCFYKKVAAVVATLTFYCLQRSRLYWMLVLKRPVMAAKT
uniref:CCHC-type domain-containing protein n=1 Tax=Nothobranchius furzeri TaxID=105023 RepID=A0A8C6MEZ7_NOTFU